MVDDMMSPSVVVSDGKGNGSGTVIAVDKKLTTTYVITNWHVVGKRKELFVQFYGEDKKHVAFVHSYDDVKDMAVIAVQNYVHDSIAVIGYRYNLRLFADTICVGASIGWDLAPSKGIISQLDFHVNKRTFNRMDCKIISGNSGGGAFVKFGDKWVYIGMPSAVAVAPLIGGFSPYGRKRGSQVTFLGLMVRIKDIREFLKLHRIIEEDPMP